MSFFDGLMSQRRWEKSQGGVVMQQDCSRSASMDGMDEEGLMEGDDLVLFDLRWIETEMR